MKEFDKAFEALTSHTPMLWQRRLFERFVTGSVPSVCDVPTGLGKTSVMAIWLLALARQATMGAPSLPRRLAYVVHRRTVVDQASEEAASYQRALRDGTSDVLREARDALLRLCVDPMDSSSPLAVSTLRGELADNRAWQADPCRATIIVGTVDLIGSRLLFSGYRSGWKMRAFDAGLVGQDALLVHDEAHLSPAFGALGREVARVQRDGAEATRALRVLELSATQRAGGGTEVFSLTDGERAEGLVARRIGAAKSLRIHELPESGDLASRLVELALRHRDARARVLVYLRRPESAQKVAAALRHDVGVERVALLTGTLRGHERDALDSISAAYRQLRASDNRPPAGETVYVVATSAGEVGANLDADHLVCDVTTIDSMIQRLGRVNRLGRDVEEFVAQIDVVFEAWRSKKKAKPDDEDETKPPLEVARDKTVAMLRHLPPRGDGHDASPGALRVLLGDPAARSAFAPPPPELPCTDVLLDAWALTAIRDALPGRPAVHPFLHGVESDPPETVVAWRDEVTDLVGLARSVTDDVVEWLDAHRLLARETLIEAPLRVAKVLIALARHQTRLGRRFAPLVVPGFGAPFVLAGLDADAVDAKDVSRRIGDATVLLPPTSGGLDDAGMLAEPRGRMSVADVADVRSDPARARLRVRLERNEDGDWITGVLGDVGHLAQSAITASTLGAAIQQLGAKLRQANEPNVERMRLVLVEDEDGPAAALVSFGMPGQADTAFDSSAAAPAAQSLPEHLDAAGEAARRIARRAGLDEAVAAALVAAARWHDVGKNRAAWQRAIGNHDAGKPLAKTSHGRFDYGICSGYRHELGSLLDATRDTKIAGMSERDLVLHLIASHHARSRPHFSETAWDPTASDEENRAAVAEASRRYSRLQRRFGRWGLAWLESLMKCSDVVATLRGHAVKELPQ
ncbi:MAG: type I-G CRISPR-associated helicase/endonuclease Cas3g [Longimicrobiales bacterium]